MPPGQAFAPVNLRIPAGGRKVCTRNMSNPAGVDGLRNGGSAAEHAQRRFRLVLADDHLDVLEAIRQFLAPDFDVLRAVNEGMALIEAVAELGPDAVITDIQMPGLSGIEAGGQILEKGLCKAVIVLTMYNDPHLVQKALQAGIRGFVLKVDANEELVPALYAVLSGETYLSRGVLERRRE